MLTRAVDALGQDETHLEDVFIWLKDHDYKVRPGQKLLLQGAALELGFFKPGYDGQILWLPQDHPWRELDPSDKPIRDL